MYLSDVTFIEEGSPDFLPVDPNVGQKAKNPELSNLINFGKRQEEPTLIALLETLLYAASHLLLSALVCVCIHVWVFFRTIQWCDMICRRLVAKTTGEIQQLQSSAYPLSVEPGIRVCFFLPARVHIVSLHDVQLLHQMYPCSDVIYYMLYFQEVYVICLSPSRRKVAVGRGIAVGFWYRSPRPTQTLQAERFRTPP